MLCWKKCAYLVSITGTIFLTCTIQHKQKHNFKNTDTNDKRFLT